MAREKELLMKVFLEDNTLSFELFCGKDDVLSVLPLYIDVCRQELTTHYLNDVNYEIDRPVARVLADEKLKQLIQKGLDIRKKHHRSIRFVVNDVVND